jgi:hypothetical protein
MLEYKEVFKKNSTMSLKSEKSVGKVSDSSIIIISDNEKSCLQCDSHFPHREC